MRQLIIPSLLVFMLAASSCGNTVKIGAQTWMVKNLDVTTYRNGDPIPEVEDGKAWANLTTGAWCYYNGNKINGKLYNWYAVNDTRKLAPSGWHIPSDAEWATLGDSVGGLAVAGGALKDASAFFWNAPNTGATNTSQFFALPDGHRFYRDGTFYELKTNGYWWTATEVPPGGAKYYTMSSSQANLYTNSKLKAEGLSVRCVKD